MAKLLFLILCITFTQISFAKDPDYQVYKVKEGDTISELVQARVLGPLYVEGGSLEKGLQ